MKRSKFQDLIEENLPRIFDAAEEGGAVLIYEEADDLFKRGSDDDGEFGDDDE